MSNLKAKWLVTALLSLTVIFAVACGDDEESDSSSANEATTEVTESTSSETTEEKTEDGELSPEQIVAELDAVEEIITEAQELYAEGKNEEALDVASSAYIKHFEEIEHPLKEYDAELMETLERHIGVDILDLIREEKSVAELEAEVEETNSLIDTARRTVEKG